MLTWFSYASLIFKTNSKLVLKIDYRKIAGYKQDTEKILISTPP